MNLESDLNEPFFAVRAHTHSAYKKKQGQQGQNNHFTVAQKLELKEVEKKGQKGIKEGTKGFLGVFSYSFSSRWITRAFSPFVSLIVLVWDPLSWDAISPSCSSAL